MSAEPKQALAAPPAGLADGLPLAPAADDVGVAVGAAVGSWVGADDGASLWPGAWVGNPDGSTDWPGAALGSELPVPGTEGEPGDEAAVGAVGDAGPHAPTSTITVNSREIRDSPGTAWSARVTAED